MSGSAPPTPLSRLFRRILTVWLLSVALFAFFWWQFGTRNAIFMGAWILLGIAVSAVRKAIFRQPAANRANRDELVRPAQVLSAVPAEAAKARTKLVWQFAGGLLYLAFISLLLGGLAVGHFLIVFAAVVASVMFTGVMILVWAVLQTGIRRNQFSISTLLILTTLAALYLGVIRLFADLCAPQLGAGDNTFLAVTIIGLILTGFSLPFLLLFMESLVWLAVWLVRQPRLQQRLRNLHAAAPPSRVEKEEGNRL